MEPPSHTGSLPPLMHMGYAVSRSDQMRTKMMMWRRRRKRRSFFFLFLNVLILKIGVLVTLVKY